jgi:hypothetical protein
VPVAQLADETGFMGVELRVPYRDREGRPERESSPEHLPTGEDSRCLVGELPSVRNLGGDEGVEVAAFPDFSEKNLADALRKRAQEAGATRVVNVQFIEGEGPDGEPALFVTLTLTNPPDELGTWPVDDLWALRRIVSDALAEAGAGDNVRWSVTFAPKDPAELDPADAEDQVEV